MSKFHVATSRRKWTKCVDSCRHPQGYRHPLGNGKLNSRDLMVDLAGISIKISVSNRIGRGQERDFLPTGYRFIL